MLSENDLDDLCEQTERSVGLENQGRIMMLCGVEWYGAVWGEHKERTGESVMDKGFVWRNGQRQKPRGACEK